MTKKEKINVKCNYCGKPAKMVLYVNRGDGIVVDGRRSFVCKHDLKHHMHAAVNLLAHAKNIASKQGEIPSLEIKTLEEMDAWTSEQEKKYGKFPVMSLQ